MFSRIYSLIASHILERTGISSGTWFDTGVGLVLLAIALVGRSDLWVTTLDSSIRMQSLLAENIRALLLEAWIYPILGDEHAIPLKDMVYDLVVSRGSYHAWRDMAGDLSEVCRVLKPGGMGYIGGGYRSAEVREEVQAARRKQGFGVDSDTTGRARFQRLTPDDLQKVIKSTGFVEYSIIGDDSGLWMMMR
jgi:SAM-dependent methyltransferase